MPKQQKSKSIEEKLQLIKNQIENHETQIASHRASIEELKTSEKQLIKELNQKKFEKIQEMIESSGLSPDELMELINQKNQNAESDQ
jgi:DNA-binding protein H-NS